jgi:hypothetical protein
VGIGAGMARLTPRSAAAAIIYAPGIIRVAHRWTQSKLSGSSCSACF